jgi:hypothetical protein
MLVADSWASARAEIEDGRPQRRVERLAGAVTSFLSPGRWAASQSPVALMVIRLLIVANTVVLGTVGALCLIFFSHPAGIVIGSIVWGVAAGLLALVPYTSPHRGDRGRW